MVNLTIDGKAVSVPEGTTILEAARNAGIRIPTLCYLKEISEIGACRICVVEIEGEQRLSAACNTPVREGIKVSTHSQRVLEARRINAELILSRHDVSCTSCVRNGSCALQEVCRELAITDSRFPEKAKREKWDASLPLQRDSAKCIGCLRCAAVCDKVQGMRVWDVAGTGSRTRIGIRDGLSFEKSGCALCGQCITHCPTGALYARNDTRRFLKAVSDPDTVTVVQIAPAVRAAFAEAAGIPAEAATEGRMAAAVKALGADYVFDTCFTADLTIMEEGSELLRYLSERKTALPMFTSCCPGWVRFVKSEYPELSGQLSTAKSPQQMFGAVAKSVFAEKAGIPEEKIFCVSVMPCVAKKYECDVPEVNAGAGKDVDLVLTTRELGRLLAGIDVASLDEIPFDSPIGSGTGAGVIFGATGGVTEAAFRSAYYLVNGVNPPAEAFVSVRDRHDASLLQRTWREAEFEVKEGVTVRAAVASGLGNTRALIEAILKGDVTCDFVEIMACPGGCAGGGGQPVCENEEPAARRGAGLYALDAAREIRFSHENPEVQALYRETLGEPLSEKAEELLHTHQSEWTM